MTEPKPELKMILGKDATGAFRLWACRGVGRGCQRNEHRKKGIRCDDCIGPLDEKLTLGEVHDRIQRGDA